MVPRQSIKKVMSTTLQWVDADTNVREIARLMYQKEIGSVLIRKNNELLGIMTEGDIVKKVLAQDLDPTATRAEEVMSYPVQTVDEGETLDRGLELMGEHHVRHLLVTRGGTPVGMVSVRAMLDAVFEWASRIRT